MMENILDNSWIKPPYNFEQENLSDNLILFDHLNGFDIQLNNQVLQKLNDIGKTFYIQYDHVLEPKVTKKYKNLNVKCSKSLQYSFLHFLKEYNIHPEIYYKNFVCSFNGSNHVGRQLLTAILKNQGYFNTDYCSKNFIYDNDNIYGHLSELDLGEDEIKVYEKFFINDSSFNNTVYSFGHVRFDHAKNIYNLEHKLTQSFLHIVSESMATSYYPFLTEKFLYSVVTRGLFLAYAQPGWHAYLERCYGFKLYSKIFDYSFDTIQNPVKRLIRLIETISKFSSLSIDDWNDLYLLERDTIEYNYNHYFSDDFIKCATK